MPHSKRVNPMDTPSEIKREEATGDNIFLGGYFYLRHSFRINSSYINNSYWQRYEHIDTFLPFEQVGWFAEFVPQYQLEPH